MKQPSSSFKCFCEGTAQNRTSRHWGREHKISVTSQLHHSQPRHGCGQLDNRCLAPILLHSGWDSGMVQMLWKRDKAISCSHCKSIAPYSLINQPTICLLHQLRYPGPALRNPSNSITNMRTGQNSLIYCLSCIPLKIPPQERSNNLLQSLNSRVENYGHKTKP
jgi:hypothetical protein